MNQKGLRRTDDERNRDEFDYRSRIGSGSDDCFRAGAEEHRRQRRRMQVQPRARHRVTVQRALNRRLDHHIERLSDAAGDRTEEPGPYAADRSECVYSATGGCEQPAAVDLDQPGSGPACIDAFDDRNHREQAEKQSNTSARILGTTITERYNRSARRDERWDHFQRH